jgi:ferredoxin
MSWGLLTKAQVEMAKKRNLIEKERESLRLRYRVFEPSDEHRNYYKCVGCGNCVDVDSKRGGCEICGAQTWLPCTT